jgi:RNA polymerase sigma factor for flagellar operon FliA
MTLNQDQLIKPLFIKSSDAQKLIDSHLDLVKRVVRGFLRNHSTPLEEIELTNAALLGLVDAINRFDPKLGDHFSSYARIRIRGALLDRVRQEDPLTRSRRNFVRQLDQVTRRLELTLQRSPEHSELAAEMKISLQRFEQLIGEIDQPIVNLEDLDGKVEEQLQGGKVSDVLDFGENDPLVRLLNVENSILIETTLEELSPKQRLCIRLSFYENLPLTRIAELLEVSVSRVSQIRTEALGLMRRYLQQFQ